MTTAIDSMFWCTGCYGNIYLFSGGNADHVGGIQNSIVLATRTIAKMHRISLAQEAQQTEASYGKICPKKACAPKIKKGSTSYRWSIRNLHQMRLVADHLVSVIWHIVLAKNIRLMGKIGGT